MRLHFLLLLLGLTASLFGQTASAQILAPSKGGGISIVRITATTIELSFGTTGNGQGRVLAIAESDMPIALAATDGQFYTANSIYGQGSKLGNGYAIYSGSDHSVIVTGLKSSTSYYFTNAEYNTDGTNIMYNTHDASILTTTRSAPLTLAPVPTPLPVELISFTGAVDANNIAKLQWATASERNSAYFAFERSVDGVTFTEAGRIAAATTSSQTLAYQWRDPQRLQNPTYYRLRQVDNDGTVRYSSVLVLAPVVPVTQLIDVYPNPSAGQPVQLLLQGYGGEMLTLHVADALGRTVMAQTLAPTNTQYSAPLALPQGLALGTYVLTLGSSSNTVKKRLVISY